MNRYNSLVKLNQTVNGSSQTEMDWYKGLVNMFCGSELKWNNLYKNGTILFHSEYIFEVLNCTKLLLLTDN